MDKLLKHKVKEMIEEVVEGTPASDVVEAYTKLDQFADDIKMLPEIYSENVLKVAKQHGIKMSQQEARSFANEIDKFIGYYVRGRARQFAIEWVQKNRPEFVGGE